MSNEISVNPEYFQMPVSTIYLIPAPLAEDGLNALPFYIIDAVKSCSAFYVEEERTARRYLKKIWKDMVIDDYRWYNIRKQDEDLISAFKADLSAGHTIGIMSEAGCPGVADPGQALVDIAQREGAVIKPLVGPSSILLALMASGMNGQQFRFWGYLPVDAQQRAKAIQKIEAESAKENCTQIFIETPYRNNQLLESLIKHCRTDTKICVAAELTSKDEWIRTMTAKEWKSQNKDLHKRTVIFLIQSL